MQQSPFIARTVVEKKTKQTKKQNIYVQFLYF